MTSQLPICRNTINHFTFERIHISDKCAHTVLATALTLGPCPPPAVAILFSTHLNTSQNCERNL